MWAVTGRFDLRYRRPVPIGQPLTAVAEIVQVRGRVLKAHGEIRLVDGTVAVEAEGTYIRIPDQKRRDLEQVLDLR